MAAQKSKKNSRSSKEDTIRLICPGCYTEYESSEPALDSERPTCPNCSLPLLLSERNRKGFKCLRCMHRAVVPEGIWCTYFNSPATTEMARQCRHYTPRRRKKRKG